LGDILSRSADQSDLTEAASAYKTAADQKKPGSYVQRRLAEMMLRGRGIQANKETAVRLFCAAGQNGSSVALSILAKFIFNGEFGLAADPRRAFELFTRAHEMNPNGMMDCAAVALMLLEGIGVDPDFERGTEKLRLAVSIYAENKPTFNANECIEQVMATRQSPDGSTSDLSSARAYLDWIAKFGVPGAMRLLDRCGGALPPHKPQWELSLLSALPEEHKGNVWWVKSPIRDRLGQPSTLGQVERLPNMRWIATTDAGVPIGDTFVTEKDAVEALAKALECDVPYVDPATRWRRMKEKPAKDDLPR